MLELENVSLEINQDNQTASLLSSVFFRVPGNHFMAIVGPSGCGKTTLLKAIAGLNQITEGEIYWKKRNLEEQDLSPNELGYVPQFSIASEYLTIRESIEDALHLQIPKASTHQIEERVEELLKQTGLIELKDRQINVLSGGQKRRLGLALELVSHPHLLLCDEVTSGLDPRSEGEIVSLLHQLSRQDGRVVINVTHSLSHLHLYDSILVLHEGKVAYHGPPEALKHYFRVKDIEDTYPQLTKRTSEDWSSSWQKHRVSYEEEFFTDQKTQPLQIETPLPKVAPFFTQFRTLLYRRFRIFFRDKTQLFLHLALIIGFPILVSIFALNGVPDMPQLDDNPGANIKKALEDRSRTTNRQLEIGSLVSGLIMLQVVLLSLMGSNNAAREIAGEREIFEKEKLSGLRPSSYLTSKIAFLAILTTIQSLWMLLFVNTLCDVPGKIFQHAQLLLLANAAITFLSLGISAKMRTPEQASILSIYLVGFQLPLSGAILALPETFQTITRPFITAYWSWSGQIYALEDSYYTQVKKLTDTQLLPTQLCLFILLLHITFGVLLAYNGIKENRWD